MVWWDMDNVTVAVILNGPLSLFHMTFVLKIWRGSSKCKDTERFTFEDEEDNKCRFILQINSPARHPSHLTMVAWNMSTVQQHVWLIIALLWLPVYHFHCVLPIHQASGRLGWWLMSVSVCDNHSYMLSCCSQTAHYLPIWLISGVTVQPLEPGSK